VAPDLVGWARDGYSCIWRKQPETAAELEQAIAAVGTSCISGHRYAGTDPAIMRRVGLDCCDRRDVFPIEDYSWLHAAGAGCLGLKLKRFLARLRSRFGALAVAFFLCALPVCAQLAGESVAEIFARAVADFENGRMAESARGFDRVAELSPDDAPHLWQRGISLYYAGRFQDCRAQFESHRKVNPDDVENAAWHFLCVARAESPQKARAALLPVGPDPRAPMREIYRMFEGGLTPEGVLAAAGEERLAQFYAQLYAGLYYEALGDHNRAIEHLTVAAEDRFAAAGYMHMVAVVHVRLLGNVP
jgi:lipoprotein NlpI